MDRSKIKVSEQPSCEADGLWSVSGRARHYSLLGSHATLPSPIRGMAAAQRRPSRKAFRTSHGLPLTLAVYRGNGRMAIRTLAGLGTSRQMNGADPGSGTSRLRTGVTSGCADIQELMLLLIKYRRCVRLTHGISTAIQYGIQDHYRSEGVPQIELH